MRKALFRFATKPKGSKKETEELVIRVPLNPSNDNEPELRISQETKFVTVNGNEQLFKLTTVMKFIIPIYSDHLIMTSKEDYINSFNVAMNNDNPVELIVTPINPKDTVIVKPIKIIQD